MTARSTAANFKGIEKVIVPSGCRPRLGNDRKPFAQIERNLESAWIESAKDLRVELVEQIDALVAVAHGSGERYDASALQALLRCANNIRGMAAMDGSELTSDIAHTVFEIVEGAQSSEMAPKSTIQLLAEGCRGLLGFNRVAKGGALHKRVQLMLRTAIARAASK